MQIIPVIDLMRGQVVHAKQGNRQHYQALQSTLCDSHHPLNVTAALLKLYPFNTIYIADLNAILGKGDQTGIIEQIGQAYPDVNLWLDCGISQVNARALYAYENTNSNNIDSKNTDVENTGIENTGSKKTSPKNNANIRVVIGSENIANLQDYRAISYACESSHILSLDYSATSALGITELHQSARFWPDETICMTLNAVGGEQGLDIERLTALIQLNTARKKPSKIYAAGGIRHIEDLKIAQKMGLTGALVATALHNGNLTTLDIDYFNSQKKPN